MSGPFTVESLSPHRALAGAADSPDPEPVPAAFAGRFVEQVIAELRKAGVQNTVKDERLRFDRLEACPGVYIHASASLTGPTVPCSGADTDRDGSALPILGVVALAKEAVRFADLLVVCGFAFDAYAEETNALGKLKILRAKMNPDLQMPDLLKKTGAGNLFMVFGEPEIAHGSRRPLRCTARLAPRPASGDSRPMVGTGGRDLMPQVFPETALDSLSNSALHRD